MRKRTISFFIVSIVLIAGLMAAVVHAEGPWAYLKARVVESVRWPPQPKDDVTIALEQAQTRRDYFYSERDKLIGYSSTNDPRYKKYMEYQHLGDMYAKRADNLEGLKRGIEKESYIMVVAIAALWSMDDLSAITRDWMSRFPEILTKVLKHGWTEAVTEAYESTFRTLIRKKIRSHLGFNACKKLETDMFAIALPSDKRPQLVQDVEKWAQAAALEGLKEKYANELARQCELSLRKKLQQMSSGNIKNLSDATITKHMAESAEQAGKLAERAQGAVDAIALAGGLLHKSVLYYTFEETVDRELSALAMLQKRCNEAGVKLGCEALMAARTDAGKCTPAVAAAKTSGEEDRESAHEGGEVKPIALETLLKESQNWANTPEGVARMKRHKGYPALQHAMSEAYAVARTGKRPRDEQLLAISQVLSPIQKEVPKTADMSNSSDMALMNVTNALALIHAQWSALPR